MDRASIAAGNAEEKAVAHVLDVVIDETGVGVVERDPASAGEIGVEQRERATAQCRKGPLAGRSDIAHWQTTRVRQQDYYLRELHIGQARQHSVFWARYFLFIFSCRI